MYLHLSTFKKVRLIKRVLSHSQSFVFTVRNFSKMPSSTATVFLQGESAQFIRGKHIFEFNFKKVNK